MLTYPLTKTGGVSLYEQLYRRIKDDILTGRLAAGEKLPSKRALAAHLEVSVITVKNAYEQLMAEGYIYGMEKRGYYVSPVQRPLAAQRAASPAAAPAPQSWEMDLVTNSIAAEDFPFTVWARLMRQTILEEGTGLLHAMPPQGAPELRTAIAAYLRQFRGMAVDGADHHRRRYGAAVQHAGAAAGPREALRRRGPRVQQDRPHLPQQSGGGGVHPAGQRGAVGDGIGTRPR